MGSVTIKEVIRQNTFSTQVVEDDIIVEEPLELFTNSSSDPLLVTMRTPCADDNLAIGLLFSLGLLGPNDSFTIDPSVKDNAIRVHSTALENISRQHVFQNSSCGLCNGPAWEEITMHSIFPVYNSNFRVRKQQIFDVYTQISRKNDDFSRTGGNHKVLLLRTNDDLHLEAEDVGRHNAFDKVIGQCIKRKLLPLSNSMAILSGRCSYEMAQKAWLAGIPIIIALGAPTSKAIELSDEVGITLIGFAKSDRFNIYSHSYRIIDEEN